MRTSIARSLRRCGIIAAAAALPLLVATGGPAAALSILLNPGSNGPGVVDRLTGLGHSVTVSNPATWTGGFDYSPYDIVAFEFTQPEGASDPTDIGHLVAAVDAGEVGVVFFRGRGATATGLALGLTADAAERALWFQSNGMLTVLDNSHFITAGMSLGAQDLGFQHMSRVDNPGADTSVLATGPIAAALVVHNTRRAVVVPFYGHPTDFAAETADSIALTERALQWAATSPPVEIGEPATLALFGLGLAGFGLAGRGSAVRRR